MLQELQQSKQTYITEYENLNKDIMRTLQTTIHDMVQEQLSTANQDFLEWVEEENHSFTPLFLNYKPVFLLLHQLQFLLLLVLHIHPLPHLNCTKMVNGVLQRGTYHKWHSLYLLINLSSSHQSSSPSTSNDSPYIG